MCRIQVLKRGRWDFFSALFSAAPFFDVFIIVHTTTIGVPYTTVNYGSLRSC